MTARCPTCGAVTWPQWLITHRPGCEYDAVDTTQWPTTPGHHPVPDQPKGSTPHA